MSTCPHCGELIDDDAESCPHCGSDYETGWNPEADYLSLDLPGLDNDDDDTYSDPYSFGTASSAGGYPVGRRDTSGHRLGVGATIGSTLTVVVALALVAAAGFPAYGWGIFGVVALLAACAIYFRRLTRRRPRAGTPPR